MFLSIITINRNNAEGLKKTLDSVASQTCRDFEHIIIDGASTDGSVDVIKEYVASSAGKNVSYWVSEPDSGIYNAINKGIKKAVGDFILVLNSGDSFAYDILETIKNRAAGNCDSILYGVVNDMKNGKLTHVEGICSGDLKDGTIAHQATFVPKKMYDKYGVYDESYKISADFDFFLKLYFAGEKFVYLNLIVANYDVSGISNTNMYVYKENILIQKKYGIYKPTLKKRIYVLMAPIWLKMK